MKNFILIPTLLLIAVSGLFAQVATPAGMRYQAIARDANGNIRSQESLTVKAELLTLNANEEVIYSEMHQTTAGEFGLLNLTIGEGKADKGNFAEIPWDKHIWIRISIKNADNDDYQLVTTSKLYSVPYAFYAATAGSVSDNSDDGNSSEDPTRDPGIGMNSINWTLEGNYNSQERNNGNPVLGTTDANDLVIVTNNVPRIVIDQNGQTEFMVDIDMDGDLSVDGATTLNNTLDVTGMNPTHLTGTLTVDKATNLNDALSVNNMASTHLTGSLDVDQTLNVDGATTLNNTLEVTGMNATTLTGTLTVGKETTLNDDLTVANMSATHLTGSLDVDNTLNVDGATTLNNTLTVTGTNATSLTGTLTVGKETTLNDDLTVANMAPTHLTGNLTVDGVFNAEGEFSVDGALEVTGMNPTHLTGTLEVDKLTTMDAGLIVSGNGTLGPNGDHVAYFNNTEGGDSDGIAIRINNNSTNKENNFITFYRGTNTVAGRIEGYQLNDLSAPPIPTSDEIWSAICITLADYNPVTLFWTQFANNFNLFGSVWNGATIPAFAIPDFPGLALPDFPGQTLPDFPGQTLPDYPGLVLPNFDGVSIPDIPSVSIEGVGTIFPGLTLPDIPGVNIPDIPSFGIPDVPGFAITDVPAFIIPDIPAFIIPDMPELDLSSDLFEIPVIPTFSDILIDQGVCPDEDIFDIPDGYVYKLIEWGVQNDMQNMISFSPVDLAAKALTWGITKVVKSGGVTYGSQGADYAEYLPKLHPTEQFMGGEIVGIHGGKASKVTTGADQILAISTKPLVLGNQPEESEEDAFAKVGFLGQVPVFVQGPVGLGDYIIPSGKNDGVGKAISSEELTADVLPLIFGKAWSSSDLETTVVINVSIGLRPNEIAEVLKKREQSLQSLQSQVNEQNVIHNTLKEDVEMLKAHLDLNSASSYRRSN